MLSSVLGVPPLAALGLAFGFTALGVFVDLQRIGTVGTVFRALYFCGCVLAVTWVRRATCSALSWRHPCYWPSRFRRSC